MLPFYRWGMLAGERAGRLSETTQLQSTRPAFKLFSLAVIPQPPLTTPHPFCCQKSSAGGAWCRRQAGGRHEPMELHICTCIWGYISCVFKENKKEVWCLSSTMFLAHLVSHFFCSWEPCFCVVLGRNPHLYLVSWRPSFGVNSRGSIAKARCNNRHM